jgi:hypothetical protein
MIEAFILPIIGKELVVKAFSETSFSIYNSIHDLQKYNHYDFKTLIEQLDIQSKIEIINLYIKEKEEAGLLTESIKKAIESLLTIIKKINSEIQEIKEEINNHKLKWFHSYRSPNIRDKISNLVNHSIVFEKRMDLLLKL